MIASLGMYDFGWNAPFLDAFWQGCRQNLSAMDIKDLPNNLTSLKDCPLASLESAAFKGELLIAQICGLHYAKANFVNYRDTKTPYRYVATPEYTVFGAAKGYYSSIIISHDPTMVDRLNSGKKIDIIVNEENSFSGCIALKRWLNQKEFGALDKFKISGAHKNSIQQIAQKQGDLAAIDAISLAICLEENPSLEKEIFILDQTSPVPALPLVTSSSHSQEFINALRVGLSAFLQAKESQAITAKLKFNRLVIHDQADYHACLP